MSESYSVETPMESKRTSNDSTDTRASALQGDIVHDIAIPPIPPLSIFVDNLTKSFEQLSPISPSPTALKFNAIRLKDDYGFFIDTPDASPHVELTKKQKKDLLKREVEWKYIIDNWSICSVKKKSKIKKLCRAGIPDSYRSQAWFLLAGADKKKLPGKFDDLTKRAESEKPKIFEVIEKDITRCFPTHEMFAVKNGQGQKNIKAVLQAYAIYNPHLGYCQGMGMLVGLLLMKMSAEDTFWMLVVLLETYVPDYHSQTLYQLRVDAAAFEVCLKKFIKPLAKHMQEVPCLTYMTQWFLTLYTMALPWGTVLRVWDMFLHDGAKVLFRAGLAMLSARKNYIIKECPGIGDMVGYLLGLPKEFTDADIFIEECLKIKLGHKDLDKMRERVKTAHSSLEEEGLVRKKTALG
ncbi:rab-GTPase-TBC domain-containing protein [Globomyces pollinis-pini]|nr:rab-GTPase-TBC domain-containing protein [Globomyces pollinis-pini]